ncbi:MAG: hypothetical protein KAX49_06900 [Halanaerobiales bacterium]|nr:hypothetical protein [Halanaerobiales bacterium]
MNKKFVKNKIFYIRKKTNSNQKQNPNLINSFDKLQNYNLPNITLNFSKNIITNMLKDEK